MRLLAIILIALLSISLVTAPNDPGHDSLYVLLTGDSDVIGSINITANLTANYIRAATLLYGDQLDIRANGTIQSVSSRPAIQSDSNDLYLDSTANILIGTRGGTTGVVQVGPTSGSGITLNVSGVIRQQNVRVCLENGSFCPSGAAESGNVTGSGSTNYIPKWISATGLGNSIITDDGNVTVDSATLAVDAANDRVGIGTANPQEKLHIVGQSTRVLINSTNKAPAKLIGNSRQNDSNVNILNVEGVWNGTIVGRMNFQTGTDITNEDDGRIIFQTASSGTVLTRMTIESDGNVGIGTDTPGNELEVIGTINATTIQVGTTTVCQSDGTNCPGGLSGSGWQNSSGSGNISMSDPNANVSANTLFVDNTDGRVGIGTTTPTDILTIVGSNAAINFTNSDATSSYWRAGLNANEDFVINYLANANAEMAFDLSETTVKINEWNMSVNSGTLFADSTNGRIGIGTTTPNTTLEVANSTTNQNWGNSTVVIGADGGLGRSEGNIKIGAFEVFNSGNDGGDNPISAPQALIVQTRYNPNASGNYTMFTVRSSGDAPRFQVIHGTTGFSNRFYDSLSVGSTGYTNCTENGADVVDCGTTTAADLYVADDIEAEGDLFIDGAAGIGTISPNNKLEVLSTTTPQVRFAYDTDSYVTYTVDSDSDLTIANGEASGRIALNPGDSDNFVTLNNGANLITYSSDNAEYGQIYHDGSNLHISTAGTSAGDVFIDENVDILGHAAIGTNSAYNSVIVLDIDETLTADASQYGIFNEVDFSFTATANRNGMAAYFDARSNDINRNGNSASIYGSYAVADVTQGSNISSSIGALGYAYSSHTDQWGTDTMYGLLGQTINDLNGTVTNMRGITAYARNDNGSVSNAYGAEFYARTFDGGSITNARGVTARVYNTSGSITTGYALYGDCDDATTCYGAYVDATDSGPVSNYGIRVVGDASTDRSLWLSGASPMGVYSEATENYFSGEIGVGVTSPGSKVDIEWSSGVGLFVGDRNPFGTALIETDVNSGTSHIWLAEGGTRVFSITGGGAGYFAGSVGIGDSSPTGSLQVTGDEVRIGNAGTVTYATTDGELYVEADLEVDGNIYGSSADLAEIFNTTESLSPGTVVELDPVNFQNVRMSTSAYSKLAAGIVSTDPGIILSSENNGTAIAISGRVPVKVNDENGSIGVGDLLTTSSTPGEAMKCPSQELCFGAILGKAMEPLKEGSGLITALVVLG